MTILLLGARGKTGSQLLAHLHPSHPVLAASRTPSPAAPYPAVAFDWHDRATWPLAFAHAQAQRVPITTVYLVGVDEREVSARVLAFVQLAREEGVRRFVAVSAWEQDGSATGPLMAPVHALLRKLGAEEGVEWAVLRPHFFMENFAEGYHVATIRDANTIYSAAGTGKLPFVSAQDIAAVGLRALTDATAHNTDHYITGGEALSYDEVAATFTRVLGRQITHVSLTPAEFQAMLEREGLNAWMAGYMTELDGKIASGQCAEMRDTVLRITGKKPRSFEEFVRDEKAVWL